jgi:hypothetical protein
MATFKGPFSFNGSVGGFRGYWDSDAQKQVLSSSKGKNKNNNKDSDRALDQNREFKAVTYWSKFIRRATNDLVYLKKGRLVGLLNRVAKQIQLMDHMGEYGYRKIESSRFNYPLKGFSFNKKHLLKDILPVEPEVTITEDRREVTLKLTGFRSFARFKWPEKVAYYRIFLTIFVLPDIEWHALDESHGAYEPAYPIYEMGQVTVVGEWIKISGDPIDYEMSAIFPENQLPKEKSVVVAVMGIEFAYAMEYGTPYVVKDNGTAGIIGCF